MGGTCGGSRLPDKDVPLQPRPPANLFHAYEDVPRVQISMDEAVHHQHLQIALHAAERDLLPQLEVIATLATASTLRLSSTGTQLPLCFHLVTFGESPALCR